MCRSLTRRQSSVGSARVGRDWPVMSAIRIWPLVDPICRPTIVYSRLFFWDSCPHGPATFIGLRGSPTRTQQRPQTAPVYLQCTCGVPRLADLGVLQFLRGRGISNLRGFNSVIGSTPTPGT